MADMPGRIEIPGTVVSVEDTASKETRALPFYMFEVYAPREGGKNASAFDLATPSQFGGMDTQVALRIPPSSLRISSPIRADVTIDILGGITVAPGGLGLRRWSIGGTHGVGIQPAMLQTAANGGLTMSKGYAVRLALANFFETWANENEKRRLDGKPLLRMLFAIRGGTLTEFQNEEWWIQPDSLPEENRTASRPLAWDWSLSFLAIARMRDELAKSDWDSVGLLPPSSRAVAEKLEGAIAGVDRVIESAQRSRFRDLLGKAMDLKDKLQEVRDRVSGAVSLYRNTVSGVAGYIRSCALLAKETLLLVDRSNLYDQPAREIFNALRDVQDAIGAAKLMADGHMEPFTPSAVRAPSATVQPGDTLQSIAAREFGDASRWHELAELNGLTYPYLDFSGVDGTPSVQFLGTGRRVLGQGDSLKLPNAQGAVIPEDPVGTDLTDAGDLRTLVGGVANLRAALLRRLRTPRGYLPHHPEYGSDLPKFVGAPLTPALILSMRAEIDRVLREDPRVLSVQSIGVSVEEDAIRIEAGAMTALGPVSLAGVVGGLVPGSV